MKPKALAVAGARNGIPAGLLGALVAGRRRGVRRAAGAGLAAYWTALHVRYRRAGKAQTAREYELLRTANWDAFTRHYNERVPTIEEEFDIWGAYHQHRHEMRYDLVADAVRDLHAPGGSILDLGCGSALVADRILDLDADYVGLDFPEHHLRYVAKRMAETGSVLRMSFVRGDGALLPFADRTFDVVVMSEVIEHLMQPELAVWEISRLLRPGGVFIMTTNNASEVPLRSPLSHPLAWLEKAIGATRPRVISLRPWIWPWPVDPQVLPPGAPAVYMPHTHHIYAQTRDLFAAAGLTTFHFSTFEFPPPQSAIAAFLDRQGPPGRRVVDLIERVARRTPIVRRLGCHLFMVARRDGSDVPATPPLGVWPGPFTP